MFRLVGYLLSIALITTGLAWLADRPGMVHVTWEGYEFQEPLFKVVVLMALAIASTIFLWSLLKAIWNSPAAFGDRILRRKQKRGLDAISSGMIAAGAGDRALASQYALEARKALPHEPLTQLLRAQAAQLSGDRGTARRIFEAMLASPDTEQLGLRGLYLEAEHEGESEAARDFAGRALRANPKLGWSADALFDHQCKSRDWARALETLSQAKRHGNVDKALADRRRAVLLAAVAQEQEDTLADKALSAALEAHTLAPDLVPAAAVAGRLLASRGNTAKAAKVLQKTWVLSPHPELATAYAFARIGDSTRDRLERVKQLTTLNPGSVEGPIAIASAALDGRDFETARAALAPLLTTRLTQRVAMLMAKIEAVETGDRGLVQEWLSRAASASLDPVWMADGIISEKWEPVSPVDGRLDAFVWQTPPDARNQAGAEIAGTRVEDLIAISAPEEPAERKKQTSSAHQPQSSVIQALEQDDPATIESATVEPVNAEPMTIVRQPTQAASPRKQQPSFDAESQLADGAADAQIVAKANGTVPAPLVPRLYVATRAPDDPGVDPLDAEDQADLAFIDRRYGANP